MKTLIGQITECIEQIIDLEKGRYKKKIIIYPCGDVGIQTINIMKNIYCLEPAFVIDNNKCLYSDMIYEISILNDIDLEEYVVFLTSTNHGIYRELKTRLLNYVKDDHIIELESMRPVGEISYPRYKTVIGKYSYGPICRDHFFIESIGAFCSFADGVDVVENHEIRYITTHPIIYYSKHIEGYDYPFSTLRTADFYMSGVEPIAEKIKKQRRAIIGNDVWLGKNVIVTNGSNIGNGVIAGAGTIITRDVPDYAVVVGVPARIIRYRYNEDQIKKLNMIAWWDWSDDEIRERYSDFYLPIDEFIKKYLR